MFFFFFFNCMLYLKSEAITVYLITQFFIIKVGFT